MSPKVRPRKRPSPARTNRSSLTEFRNERATRLDKMDTSEALDAIYAGTLNPEYRAFWRYATGPRGMTGNSLDMLDPVERRVLSKASSAAGGYAVPQDFDNQVTTLRRARSVISTVAREIETPHGQTLSLPIASTHGVSTWTAENAAFTASDEVFTQTSVGAYKASTQVIVSEELLADAIPAFDEFLAGELAGRQATLEDTALAVGDGTGKPLGIAHASSGYSVVTAATGSATVFKTADVAAAYAGLPDAYQPFASWLMAPSAFRSIAGILDTAGALVFGSMHSSTPSLYGRPVFTVPDLPTSAANARSVVFGDIEQAYTVRRVTGLGLQRQDEIFSNNGQVGFRLFWRLDGRPVDLAAAIILRHSAT